MSNHCRTNSESSYEFVKTDSESEKLLDEKLEEKKENEEASDVLSFNGDVSTEVESSDEEDMVSEVAETEDEKIIVNDETEESEESETVSLEVSAKPEEFVGDSLGLTVEIPEEKGVSMEEIREQLDKLSESIHQLENSDESDQKEDCEGIGKKLEELLQHVDVQKKDTLPTPKEVAVQSDPLGVSETPILVQSAKKEKEEVVKPLEPSSTSIIMSEITLLRYDVDKLKSGQKMQKDKIAQLQRAIERQREIERERDEKINPPIQYAICGNWRLINMKVSDDRMKADGIPFHSRFQTLLAHTTYEYDGFHLTSFNKLCCKTFNYSTVRMGTYLSPANGTIAKTTVNGKTLTTVWNDSKSGTEKKERYIVDGQLHVIHYNRSGEKTLRVYERVSSKTDLLYSIGNAGRLYLKFW